MVTKTTNPNSGNEEQESKFKLVDV